MPVSKKRKKNKKNNRNKNYKNQNQKTLADILHERDWSLFKEFSMEEAIEIYDEIFSLTKDEFKDIPGITDLLCKRFIIINELEKLYKGLKADEDTELLIIGVAPYQCALKFHPYIHEQSSTLIISQISYLSDKKTGECIQPLKPITQLADVLNIDLVFPAYISGDAQEDMFKSFGFKESKYPAEEGQKILLRKSNRKLMEAMINAENAKYSKVSINVK